MNDLARLVAAPGANAVDYFDPAFPDRRLVLHSARPRQYDAKTPILFVHHGVARNGATYRDYWLEHVDPCGILAISIEVPEATFPEYLRFLAMPSDAVVPADIQKNAAFLEDAFRKRGFEARQLDNQGKPMVFAEMKSPTAGARTVLAAHAAGLAREGVTSWACYPKANQTDINRDTLWPIFIEYGLRPNGVAALDDVWSAMRYRALKAGETFHGMG